MIKKVKKLTNFFYYKHKKEQDKPLPNLTTEKAPVPVPVRVRYHTGNLTMYGYMSSKYCDSYNFQDCKIENDFIIV